MDDFFFWLPLIMLVVTVLFVVLGFMALSDRKHGTLFFSVALVVFAGFIALSCIYQNGYGHAITVSKDERGFHRLVPGETYTVVYQSSTGAEVLLKGRDGVRYYSFEQVVPRTFLVRTNYTLQEILNQ